MKEQNSGIATQNGPVAQFALVVSNEIASARVARQSGGLLILRSWVQIPSGPPLSSDS